MCRTRYVKIKSKRTRNGKMVMDEILVKNVDVKNVVDIIIEEIAELTKINSIAPTTLTITEDIKAEIFKIKNIEASSSQQFSEFKGLNVKIIPNNTILNWVIE